ncbi:unnamed protein product [Spirodela intermedia]|uniref:Uncharacterized protein n=1 Tax=Spirodela intermedia TaxID=51605 RepID=A0A7I8L8G9_SPIIN|nr:unnamed protein product [Spirodela intermedia]
MRQSKHIEFICKYIEKFSIMLLEVLRMDKDDKFHYFTKRLQRELIMSFTTKGCKTSMQS